MGLADSYYIYIYNLYIHIYILYIHIIYKSYIYTLYSYPKEFADPVHPQKHQGTSLAATESPQLFPGSPGAFWRPPSVFPSEAHRHRTSSTCSLGCWDAIGMGSWNWDEHTKLPHLFCATFIATFLKKMMIDIDRDTPLDFQGILWHKPKWHWNVDRL